MADQIIQRTVRGTARKKAVEACERCRGKRIKVNTCSVRMEEPCLIKMHAYQLKVQWASAV